MRKRDVCMYVWCMMLHILIRLNIWSFKGDPSRVFHYQYFQIWLRDAFKIKKPSISGILKITWEILESWENSKKNYPLPLVNFWLKKMFFDENFRFWNCQNHFPWEISENKDDMTLDWEFFPSNADWLVWKAFLKEILYEDLPLSRWQQNLFWLRVTKTIYAGLGIKFNSAYY
jgi:hypothetical protein